MRFRNRILTLFIFTIIWCVLILFSYKRAGIVNTIKNAVKPVMNRLFIDDDVMLCDFELSKDFSVWQLKKSHMERSSIHVYSGESSAKVVFLRSAGKSTQVPGIALEDYNIGPCGERDWSRFASLRLAVFNPYTFPIGFQIKLKDRSGRMVYRDFKVLAGENELSIDLESLGSSIDLRNMLYVAFFVLRPPEDIILYLDSLELKRGNLDDKPVSGQPKVTFIKLSAVDKLKRGTTLTLACDLSISDRLYKDYKIFVHISQRGELKKKPSKRRWYINADHYPWLPTSGWEPNRIYTVGPIEVFFPEHFPLGPYAVQIGLYNPDIEIGSSDTKTGTSYGAFDFRGTYPRLRYTNPDLKDYIVGYVDLED